VEGLGLLPFAHAVHYEHRRKHFHAGANVIVYNATPARHRDRYLIYGKDRKVSGYDYIQQVISDAGLRPGRSVFTGAALADRCA